MRYEGDRIAVFFDDEGYKTLSLPAALSRSLLIPVEPVGVASAATAPGHR